jgi:hypothetical protein
MIDKPFQQLVNWGKAGIRVEITISEYSHVDPEAKVTSSIRGTVSGLLKAVDRGMNMVCLTRFCFSFPFFCFYFFFLLYMFD